jgi:hypothetical protein
MTTTERTLTLPTQRGAADTRTAYTILAGTMVRYAGFDEDDATRALTDLLEAEEEDVTVYATTGHLPDPDAAQAVLDEATVEASAWPECGYPELLDPAEWREHINTCRTCGRED